MVFKTCLLFIALFCAGQCNPLGQTTLCEHMPNVLPVPGSTAVYETTPNVLGFGLGLGPLGLNLLQLPKTTLVETTPSIQYGLTPFGPIAPVPSSTTVCESTPNVGGPLNPLGLGPLLDQANLGPNYYPLPPPNVQVPSTTVCESSPNVYGLPNLSGLPGLPGLPYSLLGGLPYGLSGIGLGLPMPMLGGLPGLAVGPLGVPLL